MEGATKGWMELGKGSPEEARSVCFFRCYLRGSILKDTVTSYNRFVIGNSFGMKGGG